MKRSLLLATALALTALLFVSYLAPVGQSIVASGLSYPILGLGHLLAAVALGVWAARLGEHAPVVLPIAFTLAAGFGIALGFEAVLVLPLIELFIWASTLELVLAAVYAVRLSLGEAVGLAVLFGIFHGQALGTALGPAGLP